MLSSGFEDGGDVLGEPELVEGLDDVVARDGLLGLLLRDLVRLGADEGDELDAAFYEDVTSLLGKRDAGPAGEDLADYFLDGG